MQTKTVVVVIALCAGTRAAAAEEGNWLSFGANAGYGVGDSGFLLGAELSLFRLGLDIPITSSRDDPKETGRAWWFGGYADAIHDFGTTATRLSIGPEIGYGILGLDGGYLLELADDGNHHGVTVRAALTVGVVSLYGRYSLLADTMEPNRGELGVLLKMPVKL